MPRNGSSVYSLPAGNPVVAGTVIATTWANTTLSDIATALTQSLSTDGSTASVSLSGKTMAGGTFSSPTVSGPLNLTSGQIQFPAVQVPSAGANVLDDYEEGTWTPTLTFSTAGNVNVVYSVRTGDYTKIGRNVNLAYFIQTTTFTHTTAAGDLWVTGIPFTPTSNGTSGAMRIGGAIFAIGVSYNGFVTNLDVSAILTVQASGVNNNTIASLQASHHTSGVNVLFSGCHNFIAS